MHSRGDSCNFVLINERFNADIIFHFHPLFSKNVATKKIQERETPLSEKEKAVLEALSDDLSVKMIAHRLSLSEFTVQDHIKKIKTKLGAHTASGIVAHAIRSGMI